MAKDILYDDDGDLAFENGDFVKGDSTNQQIEDLLIAAPGHYRQFPTVGANITQHLNGDWSQKQAQAIQIALEADGIKVKGISMKDGVLEIDRNS